MKTIIILLVMSLCFCSFAHAQGATSFTLEIDSLPGLHIWNNNVDPNETGKLTNEQGSENMYIFSQNDMLCENKKTTHSGDTVIFTNKIQSSTEPSGTLTLIFDGHDHLRKFEFTMVTYNNYDHQIYYLFRAEDIQMIETPDAFQWQLTGDEILKHNIFDTSYEYKYYLSGGQSFAGIYVSKKDSIVAGSSVFFTITKDFLQNLGVSTNQGKNTLSLYPTPVATVLTVDVPNSMEVKTISVLDILGRSMISSPIDRMNNKLEMNVSSLPPGIYYLRAGDQMQKFVIQR